MKSGPKPRPAEDRFDEMVVKQDGGCWLWNGEKGVKRYGAFSLGQGLGTMASHRYSYLRYKGEIPDGLVVRHTCDVKNCCNPDHLILGTQQDNVRDAVERGRATGHGKATLNRRLKRRSGQRKLHRDEIQKIKDEYATGKFTQFDLASRWNVSQATISATIRGVHNCGTKDGVKRKRDTSNMKRKLSLDDYQKIRDMYATGQHTQTALALQFNCDQTYVSAIVNNKLRSNAT
ncbi:MAG: HNH endonuclease signature motif containing protein [Rhodanobacter sp.]